MYVHIPTDQVVQVGQPFTFNGTSHPAAYTQDPASMLNLGFTEVTRVDEAPTDPENYYRTETRTGAVVTAQYTRKSDEQIKQQNNAKIDQQIAAMEQQALVPRATREFMLGALPVITGKTPAELLAGHAGYQKLVAFESAVAALRSQRKP